MFWPWKSTSPSARAVGTSSFMRLKERSMVLLPQPDGPMMAVIFWLDLQVDVLDGPKVTVVDAQIVAPRWHILPLVAVRIR